MLQMRSCLECLDVLGWCSDEAAICSIVYKLPSVPVSAVSAGGAGGGGAGHNVLLCRDPATDRSLVPVV